MSLMTIRHKPIRPFVWLTCLLTFYLGFNQQVMCFELSPNGEVQTLHLQLIECSPLSPYTTPAKHPQGTSVPDVLTLCPRGNGCPTCKDFHLSFKKIPGIDISSLVPLVSFLPADYPIQQNRLAANTITPNGRLNWPVENLIPRCNSSIAALSTTILLI